MMNYTHPHQKLPDINLPPNVPPPVTSIESLLPLNPNPKCLLPQPVTQYFKNETSFEDEIRSSTVILPYSPSSTLKLPMLFNQETVDTLYTKQDKELTDSQQSLNNKLPGIIDRRPSVSETLTSCEEKEPIPSTTTPSPIISTTSMTTSQTLSFTNLTASSIAQLMGGKHKTPDGTEIKKKRGRPRKHPLQETSQNFTPVSQVPLDQNEPLKRKRGRPRLPPLEVREKSRYIKKAEKGISPSMKTMTSKGIKIPKLNAEMYNKFHSSRISKEANRSEPTDHSAEGTNI